MKKRSDIRCLKNPHKKHLNYCNLKKTNPSNKCKGIRNSHATAVPDEVDRGVI